jgi:hypothetical protein
MITLLTITRYITMNLSLPPAASSRFLGRLTRCGTCRPLFEIAISVRIPGEAAQHSGIMPPGIPATASPANALREQNDAGCRQRADAGDDDQELLCLEASTSAQAGVVIGMLATRHLACAGPDQPDTSALMAFFFVCQSWLLM